MVSLVPLPSVPFAQMRPQPLFHVRSHVAQGPAAVPEVEVVDPAA